MKNTYFYIISLSLFLSSTETKSVDNANWWSNATTLRMYQMLKDVHDLFTVKDITYWIDFGTALGAVRHTGLNPWDDDHDVAIDISQAADVENLKPLFHKLGYGLIPFFFGYKIFPLDGEPYVHDGKVYNFTTPYLDIFFTFVEDDKVFYTSPSWGNRGEYKLYKTLDELFPLKDYVFGALIVRGPQNPIPYFNAFYGEDWFKIAKVRPGHPNKKIAGKTFALTDEDRISALPILPLEDRVAYLI